MNNYNAKDIEVLEGLEPVRKRPGMYIGGVDQKAMHHLFAEALDNAMDEATAGHASIIHVSFDKNGFVGVKDNGRGIPIDKHPKFTNLSALEVILTTLHAGGKFSGKAYETAGGLHGVGISVVNALSCELIVEVARGKTLYRQHYSRGKATSKLEKIGKCNTRGTFIKFKPDPKIFGENAAFKPRLIYEMSRAKAFLFAGVEIRWEYSPQVKQNLSTISGASKASGKNKTKVDNVTNDLSNDGNLSQPDHEESLITIPLKATLKFLNGLSDYLAEIIAKQPQILPEIFAKNSPKSENGSVSFALTWSKAGFKLSKGQIADGFIHSYCNTIPTAAGGTHENGLRSALLKELKNYAQRLSIKKVSILISEDITHYLGGVLSIFIANPEFQGQTKDKLSTPEAFKIVETVVRREMEFWLNQDNIRAEKIINFFVDIANERIKRRKEKDISRAHAGKLYSRLPGKLADCSSRNRLNTELFIVEGDSAGGSAKQARDRKLQAILPIRGKILNVASASQDKIMQNEEVKNLVTAIGCGIGTKFILENIRYEKIIIMTDADVDGAHIATLLMTFFHSLMPELITHKKLFLACPPLYRIKAGQLIHYALDDEQKDKILKKHFTKFKNIEISRFKGLGEMMPAQLKETTMSQENRHLISVNDDIDAKDIVNKLMGKSAEKRFQFLQENASEVMDILDV